MRYFCFIFLIGIFLFHCMLCHVHSLWIKNYYYYYIILKNMIFIIWQIYYRNKIWCIISYSEYVIAIISQFNRYQKYKYQKYKYYICFESAWHIFWNNIVTFLKSLNKNELKDMSNITYINKIWFLPNLQITTNIMSTSNLMDITLVPPVV